MKLSHKEDAQKFAQTFGKQAGLRGKELKRFVQYTLLRENGYSIKSAKRAMSKK